MAVAAATCTLAFSHEIPADVTIRAFVHPRGERLHFLVRVPLEAMQDIQFPQTGPGYLDLEAAGPALSEAARRWIATGVTLLEDGRALAEPRLEALRVSLPSDRSFGRYTDALAHLRGDRLPAGTPLPWNQAMLDVLFVYAIESAESDFSIRPALARLGLRTTTVLRFVTPGGVERAYQYSGDPGVVRLDPRWHQAALHFVQLGFFHILDGVDHLLFLLCLIIPIRRLWPLVPIVTAFTVAHSITLIASAFGLAPRALWFPPLIETLIALSIVYMSLENIVGPRIRRRWQIAFAFGLVHGFGFSFVLRESMQFAGSHLLASLLAFNVGVEIGQLVVIAVAVPALALLFRQVLAERVGVILLSALVAHSAWHWMSERGAELLQYRFTWPAIDGALFVSLGRWLLLVAILIAVLRVLASAYARLLPAEARADGADKQQTVAIGPSAD